MYWGMLAVSGIAFACSTELIPELNEQLKLVKFTTEFKLNMTATMIVDFVGCWIIEQGLKTLFSDFRPKDIAVRRPDQLEVEAKRKALEAEEKAKEKDREMEIKAAGEALRR
jgi:cation-transporting ATPase 13A1